MACVTVNGQLEISERVWFVMSSNNEERKKKHRKNGLRDLIMKLVAA